MVMGCRCLSKRYKHKHRILNMTMTTLILMHCSIITSNLQNNSVLDQVHFFAIPKVVARLSRPQGLYGGSGRMRQLRWWVLCVCCSVRAEAQYQGRNSKFCYIKCHADMTLRDQLIGLKCLRKCMRCQVMARHAGGLWWNTMWRWSSVRDVPQRPNCCQPAWRMNAFS